MADEAILHYWDGRGLAEIARLTMAVTGIKFKEEYIASNEDFKKLSDTGHLPFGQAPLLQIDGLNLVQSRAIVNYLAAKGGLLGDSPAENASIDILSEGATDFNQSFLAFGFQEEAMVKARIEKKVLPKYLPAFEKALSESKSGYLVGAKLTKADVCLLLALMAAVDYFSEACFKDYPAVQAFYKRMLQNERVAHYISKIRKRPTDERLVREVKASIPWFFE